MHSEVQVGGRWSEGAVRPDQAVLSTCGRATAPSVTSASELFFKLSKLLLIFGHKCKNRTSGDIVDSVESGRPAISKPVDHTSRGTTVEWQSCRSDRQGFGESRKLCLAVATERRIRLSGQGVPYETRLDSGDTSPRRLRKTSDFRPATV